MLSSFFDGLHARHEAFSVTQCPRLLHVMAGFNTDAGMHREGDAGLSLNFSFQIHSISLLHSDDLIFKHSIENRILVNVMICTQIALILYLGHVSLAHILDLCHKHYFRVCSIILTM